MSGQKSYFILKGKREGNKWNKCNIRQCLALRIQAFFFKFLINCIWTVSFMPFCVCVCVHVDILKPFYEKQLSNGTLYQPSNRHFIMGAVITNTLCRIMMAVAHTVHYTSVCHMALRIMCVCLCVSLFLSFYNTMFQQINIWTIGKKNIPSFTIGDKQYILDNDCIYWLLHL